jgi:hypothetical protein
MELQPSKPDAALLLSEPALSDRTSSIITKLVHYRKQPLTHITSPLPKDQVHYWNKQPLHDRSSPLLPQPLHTLAGDYDYFRFIIQNIVGQREARSDRWGCRNVLSGGACHTPYGVVTGKTSLGEQLLQLQHLSFIRLHRMPWDLRSCLMARPCVLHGHTRGNSHFSKKKKKNINALCFCTVHIVTFTLLKTNSYTSFKHTFTSIF